MGKLIHTKKTIVSFLVPALVLYTLFAILPIIQSIRFSFYDWPGIQGIPLKFVGWNNFMTAFQSEVFWHSVKNVLWFIVINLIFQIVIGYGLALLLSRLATGYKFFKVAFFCPVILPLTATALVWNFIYFPNDIGILNQFLAMVGLEKFQMAWLVDPSTAMTSIAMANVWSGFGYHMVIGIAALAAIPDSILESATLDGASGARQFFNIKLPLIWESMKISVVLIITGSMKNFDIIFVLTGGGPNGLTHVPSTLMYYEAYKYDHYGLGSAISVLIFAACLLLAYLSMRLMKKETIEF